MTTRGTSLLYYKIKTEGEEETILPDDGDCKVVRVKEEELTSTEDEDSSSDDKCKTRTRVSIKKEHNSNSDSENYDDQLLLPELANLPLDFNTETYIDSGNKQIVAVPSIKIEDKVETNKNHSFSEEGDCEDPPNNDDPSYKTNSSEDDTDDEEYFSTKDGATGSRLPSVDDSNFSCQICFRHYSSRKALTVHMRRHRDTTKHVCPHCGVSKVTRTELQTHLRVHLPNVEKFPCPQCPQVFRHKNAISRHVKVVHEGQRQYCCDYCPKRFSTRNAKVGHERLHTGERPFSCKECGKECVKQETLRTHMKSHDKNLRTHICSYCSQRFITLRNLINHEQRHKGDKPHICHICSKGFSKNEDLQFHLSIFHPNRMEEEYYIDSQNTN